MKYLICSNCGSKIKEWHNPCPTVDVIIYNPDRGIVLVRRGTPPYGYALPGGFVETGESVENAAVREAKEETNLDIVLTALLGVYSDPERDPRRHTLSTVFIASCANPDDISGGDDAERAFWCAIDELPELVFDHGKILAHFSEFLRGRRRVADIVCG